MRRIVFLFAMLCFASGARAEVPEPERRFGVGASVGFALPIGSAESGSRMSDMTYGVVPLDLDAVYRLTRYFGLGAWFRYGVLIPTLCATANDCEKSLGSDIALEIRARFFLPHLGPAHPEADAGIGYEWFASKLADRGVTSIREYHGPVLFSATVAAPFRLSSRWMLGPFVGASIGTFTNWSLAAPGIEEDASVRERSLHAWLSVGGRGSFVF